MIYLLKCPKCGGTLSVDDIDYNFKGCQDEIMVCNACHTVHHAKVRYGKVVRVESKSMVWSAQDGWHTED